MWLFHIYSCFSISDSMRFCENMASKGFCLDKCNYFADHFVKGKPEKSRFATVPKAYFDHDLTNLINGWDYIAQNRNYYILKSNGNNVSELPFSIKEIGKIGEINLLKVIAFTAILCHICSRMIRTQNSAISIIISGIGLLCWFGFTWSTFLETYEMYYYKKHNSFLPFIKARYRSSIIVLVLTNLAHILLILLLLYMFSM